MHPTEFAFSANVPLPAALYKQVPIHCHWIGITAYSVHSSAFITWKMNKCAPFFAVVYLSLEPTWYRSRNRLRSGNYFPQWSEYESSVTLDTNESRPVLTGLCQLSLKFHIFSFPFFSFWTCTCSFISELKMADIYRLLSSKDQSWDIPRLNSMVFLKVYMWKLHAASHIPLMLKAHDKPAPVQREIGKAFA